MPATYPSRRCRARRTGSAVESPVGATACDARMNSAVLRANSYGGADASLVYSGHHDAAECDVTAGWSGVTGGGNSLGESRVAMSEVQIGGIPKQSTQEVAPTP